jgi:hypothetical protein
MKYKSTNSGFGYVIRLEKGEKLIESIKNFAEKENLDGGFFYGLGAVEDVFIGYYDLAKKEYIFSEMQGTYELASLNGNIALSDNKVVVHAHGVLGDNNLNTVAGHIKEATVAITVEIFVHLQHGTEMKRLYDEKTGLNLLDF